MYVDCILFIHTHVHRYFRELSNPTINIFDMNY